MSPRYPGPECCYSATSSGSDNRKPGGLGSRDDALIVRDHALEVGAELTGGGHVDGVEGAQLGGSAPPSHVEGRSGWQDQRYTVQQLIDDVRVDPEPGGRAVCLGGEQLGGPAGAVIGE